MKNLAAGDTSVGSTPAKGSMVAPSGADTARGAVQDGVASRPDTERQSVRRGRVFETDACRMR